VCLRAVASTVGRVGVRVGVKRAGSRRRVLKRQVRAFVEGGGSGHSDISYFVAVLVPPVSVWFSIGRQPFIGVTWIRV